MFNALKAGRVKLDKTPKALIKPLLTLESMLDRPNLNEDILDILANNESEIEAVKEEKDRKLDLVEFLPISDIEEEDHKIDNEDLIELVLDIVKRDKEPKPSLL
ncbi:uncharacterized protein N7525_002303 [Penicillium rubens]|uniref:uncharacterized protein n=1 Tax=Penicillium rubens TaxID=1108849 RepID=UPI002A5A9B58|nr:uncharacterized protein N7525_002303 [Penicillium rubens]KAJ5844562.1 hypothetical protein N7525_002303 [Penicillium rubens]KAJ5844842.1 hypothetical protein N7534_008511 [Penicillium rubens]